MSGARRPDFDVVIVGGGMVGLATAALVSREPRLAGLRLAVVEKSPSRPPVDGDVDLRVSALSRASERVLAAAGAWAAIEPHACPYERMIVWDAAGTPEGADALRFDAAEAGEPDLGHIAENLRIQWALAESPALRAVTQLRAGLEGLQRELPVITELRGRGLIQGVRLAHGAEEVQKELYRAGLITNRTGGDVIRLLPPYVVTSAQIARGLDILREVLHRTSTRVG